VVSKVFINAIFQLFPAFQVHFMAVDDCILCLSLTSKEVQNSKLGGWKQAKPTKLGEAMGVGYKRTTKDEIVTQSIPFKKSWQV